MRLGKHSNLHLALTAVEIVDEDGAINVASFEE